MPTDGRSSAGYAQRPPFIALRSRRAEPTSWDGGHRGLSPAGPKAARWANLRLRSDIVRAWLRRAKARRSAAWLAGI